MDIIDGIDSIGKGIVQIGRGVLMGIWGFIKLLAASVVFVIIGIYYAVKGIFEFAKKAYRKLKKQRPNVTVDQTGSVTNKVLSKALSEIESEISTGQLKLSDLEKEEVEQDLNHIRSKLNVPGKVTGMHYISGINEDGEEEVFDIEIFAADAYDKETARRDREGKSFVQPITN